MDNPYVAPEGTAVQPEDLQVDTGANSSAEPRRPLPNPFRALWAGGYERLVPIVPPGAQLSVYSSLFKRPESRGKAVGELAEHGWRGMEWHKRVTTEHDLDRWAAMGAGVGCRMGEGLVAIDIDALDQVLSLASMKAAFDIFGDAPRRIGRPPKMLLLYRCASDIPYQRVDFKGADGSTQRVEVLGPGQQAVFIGTHPGTMKPYRWADDLPARDMLTEIDADQVRAFFDRLVEILPEASRPASANGQIRDMVDQDKLVGDIEAVKAAVARIPNDRSDRTWYLRMGYGIKAALRDHPEEAFDLFWEWCDRWIVDGHDKPKDYDKTWSFWTSLQPPFAVGADYLYGEAARQTGENMTPADKFFEPVPEGSVDTSAFANLDTAPEKQRVTASDTFELLGIDGLLWMSDPKYLIGRHLPENALGFLYGDPGTGKSFIALDWALHIAFGFKTWHGDPINASAEAHVVYIAGEGVAGLKSRVLAWMHRHAVGDARGRFSLLAHSVNLMDRDEVQKLARTIRAGAPGTVLVVVDTVSRSMLGADENQQKEMTRFVQACDVIRSEFKSVVLGVHHAARQGGNMRGSTVLGAAGDFTFKLERKPAAVAGKLTCEKQKDASDGWSQPYRFDTVAYPGSTSLVPTRCLTADGDGAPVPAAQEEQILDAIEEAWRSGEPWGQGAQSRDRYAGTQLVKAFGFEVGRAQELIRTLEDQGMIAIEMVDRKRKKAGYRRLAVTSASSLSGNVFD